MIVNVQDGLVRINSDDLKETPVEMPGIGDTVAWMENTGPRTGLLISTRGLFRLNGYEAELLLSAAEIPAQMNMGRITQDEDGSLWMMNNDKCVYYLKKTPGGFAPALRYFTGQVISRVYNDREGNRWFTTIGNGSINRRPTILRFRPNTFPTTSIGNRCSPLSPLATGASGSAPATDRCIIGKAADCLALTC